MLITYAIKQKNSLENSTHKKHIWKVDSPQSALQRLKHSLNKSDI